jgi:CBS domain-containing protein
MTDNKLPTPLLVRDLQTIGVTTCSPNTSVTEIARILLERDLEAVVVLDPIGGHAIGVVSQDELVKAFGNKDVQSLNAEAIMRYDIPQVPADIPITAAAQIMRDQGSRALYIMHQSTGIAYPAAVLTYKHILRLITARDDNELKDLGIHAERKLPLETFYQRRDEARKRAGGG